MAEFIFPTITILAALIAAWGLILGAVGSLQITRKFKLGLMHYFFAALFFGNGISILLSKRNFSTFGLALDPSQTLSASPIAAWLIRLTSLILVIASADQIAKRIGQRDKIELTRKILAAGLIYFWFCNILLPSFLSTHKTSIQLSWLYTPILCLGLILMTKEAGTKSIIYCRNAIVIFCAASLAMIALRPDLVLQIGYAQGYIPGVPRFAGLAPHAIVMGLASCVGVWCLLSYPLKSKFWHVTAMCICLLSLFLAQSKAVWISLLITLPILLAYRGNLPSLQTMMSPKYRLFTAIGIAALGLIISGAAGYVVSGSFAGKLHRFLASSDGVQITSFTGRDKIWEVAISEWLKSPIFGYGLLLFGAEHQAQIGMSFATSGHNQIIDGLGRAGLIGATSTVMYSIILAYFGLKYGKATRGLSAVLSISIIIRMISEVPLTLGNLAIDAIPHYLLLAVLATHIGSDSRSVKEPAA